MKTSLAIAHWAERRRYGIEIDQLGTGFQDQVEGPSAAGRKRWKSPHMATSHKLLSPACTPSAAFIPAPRLTS
jgi:hypothetical protein